MKNVAVQGCILDQSTAQITTPPSSVITAANKGIYSGDITIVISGYGTGTNPASAITDTNGFGSATLKGSSKNCFEIKGKKEDPFVLEGDNVKVTVNGTSTSGTTVTPVSETVTVTIKSAGQTFVTAD